MSHTAHIPSHRKPRRSAPKAALRAGVATGVLGTLAVAGASGPASAAEPATDTIEMPTLTADLSTQLAKSVDATQQAAAGYALRAEQQTAAVTAAKAAEKAQATAEKKAAEAKKKAAEKAAAHKAAEAARASRSGERSTLSTASTPDVSIPAGGSVATVIGFLKSQVGDAYIMGGTGPNSWDCSGLVQAAFKQAGVSLPRTSQEQSTSGTQVPLSSVQVGDILYWGGAGSAYHVAVYVGGGQYLDAANPSKGVLTQDLSGYPASGAVRVL